MKHIKLVTVLLFVACVDFGFAAKLQEKFKWKEVSYAWPSEQAKEEAITSGRYKAENNLPLGLDLWKDKLFITVPRYVEKNQANEVITIKNIFAIFEIQN